MIDVCSN